jgi:hypothetical protein
MSSEVGRIRGQRHPAIVISRSDGGVEMTLWEDEVTGRGTYDSMSPDAARGLAALLTAAADICDKRIAERLKSP